MGVVRKGACSITCLGGGISNGSLFITFSLKMGGSSRGSLFYGSYNSSISFHPKI